MIDLNTISPKDLIRFGIRFNNQEEAVLFTEYIIEEFEVRVGRRIARNVSENDIAIFDQLTDRQEISKWLQEYCPSYKYYIEEEQEFLIFDILKNRYYLDDVDILSIPGINDSFDNLKISLHNRKLLEEAHLLTIDDFLRSNNETLNRRLRGANKKQIMHAVVNYLFGNDKTPASIINK